MSTTLNQFLGDKPRLEVATDNFRFHKKLRRLVAETIDHIHNTTAKVDLASKVIQEVSKTKNMKFLFGDEFVREKTKEPYFIYDHIEEAVMLSCERFTGVKQQSKFEAELIWKRSNSICPNKKLADGNKSVLLSNLEDKNRVYVLDPSIEVAIVDGISPMLLLDKDVEDRSKYSIPREVAFVKLNELKTLMLFHSYNDGVQKRYLIPTEKTKNFKFKPLHEGYIQDGLQLAHRAMDGSEFDLNQLGEVKTNKRYLGIPLEVYVLDFTNRGRMGTSTKVPVMEVTYG
jgi:hypothetical protein